MGCSCVWLGQFENSRGMWRDGRRYVHKTGARDGERRTDSKLPMCLRLSVVCAWKAGGQLVGYLLVWLGQHEKGRGMWRRRAQYVYKSAAGNGGRRRDVRLMWLTCLRFFAA